MAVLRWSPEAVEDLEQLVVHISRDSPVYAGRFAAQVIGLVEDMSRHPRSGRVVPELGRPNLREWIYQGYRIIHRVGPSDEYVEVVRIQHGRRPLT